MFGFDSITDRTIEAVKKSGGKINLSFKGEGFTAEIDLRGKNGNTNRQGW